MTAPRHAHDPAVPPLPPATGPSWPPVCPFCSAEQETFEDVWLDELTDEGCDPSVWECESCGKVAAAITDHEDFHWPSPVRLEPYRTTADLHYIAWREACRARAPGAPLPSALDITTPAEA